MLYEHFVVFIDSLSVIKQLLQITDVLFDHVGDLFQLRELVAVVFFEHAFRTY